MIPVRAIQEAVAAAHGIGVETLMYRGRKWPTARPRQAAMFLVREIRGDLSLPQIARIFGGFNHTTVLHAVVETGRRAIEDAGLAARLDIARVALLRSHT